MTPTKLNDPLYVRLKPGTEAQIRDMARDHEQPVSRIIREIIEKHFKRNGK